MSENEERRHRGLKRDRHGWIRILAVLLCAALLCAAPLTARANPDDLPDEAALQEAELQEAEFPQEELPQADAAKPPLSKEELPDPIATAAVQTLGGFWSIFRFLTFQFVPGEYAYNAKISFQWLFGFNRAYDALAFLGGAFYDTIRCEFTYEGRDWLVQLWKGAYAYCLCTGGEMGIYSKPAGSPINHYYAPTSDKWIGMEFSIYHWEEKLFTRPMEDTWWATGYKFYIMTAPLDNPRPRLTMEATLRFPNEDMAVLFSTALVDKGFTSNTELPFQFESIGQYTQEGETVYLQWRNLNEGYR